MAWRRVVLNNSGVRTPYTRVHTAVITSDARRTLATQSASATSSSSNNNNNTNTAKASTTAKATTGTTANTNNTNNNTYKGVANIPSLLQAATDRFEYRDAVVCDVAQARWTFLELNQHVQSLATGLSADKLIAKGKVLASMADASLERVTLPLASAALGAVYTNLPSFPSSPEELVKLLQDSEARALVFPTRHGQRDNVVFMNQVVPELCLLTDEQYFTSRLLPHLRCLLMQTKNGENGIRPLQEKVQPGVLPLPIPPASSLAGSDAAFVYAYPDKRSAESNSSFQFSTFSQEGVVAAGKAWQEILNLGHDDRVCVGASWSRTLATACGIIAPLHAGAVTLLPAPYVAAEPILRTVERDHATHLLLDTQSASLILKHPLLRKVRPANLRSIILEVESTETTGVSELVEKLSAELGKPAITIAFSHPSVFGAYATASSTQQAQLLPYLQAKSDQSGLSFKGSYAMRGPWNSTGAGTNKDGWVQTAISDNRDSSFPLSLSK